MTRRIIHIIILGLLSISGYCGTPYCDIRKFSILDGLAANNISDLCQGADNMMWFATYNGLSYYDGYTFPWISPAGRYPVSCFREARPFLINGFYIP